MTARLNLLLLCLTIACALGVVSSQHKARKFFMELQKEQELARKMEVEWGKLQLEQSTWSMHSRIEKIAADRLHMRVPDQTKIQVVSVSKKAPITP